MSSTAANTAEFQDAGKPVADPVYLVGLNGDPTSNASVSQANYVPLKVPIATQTSAGSDTVFTFNQQVNTVILQNNTAAVVNYAFDSAASAGSLSLAAGQMLIYSKKVTAVHLFTAAAQNVNGTTAGNIVLLGEL